MHACMHACMHNLQNSNNMHACMHERRHAAIFCTLSTHAFMHNTHNMHVCILCMHTTHTCMHTMNAQLRINACTPAGYKCIIRMHAPATNLPCRFASPPTPEKMREIASDRHETLLGWRAGRGESEKTIPELQKPIFFF